MRVQFFLLVALLLFARGCDFYSTSLWFCDSPTDETNPLVWVLGFGWTGLVFVNVVLVLGVIYTFYYYSFRHRPVPLHSTVNNWQDYMSMVYFNEKGKAHKILYSMPVNRRTLLGHMGYVLIRVLILASFLATVHNLCQFYQVTWYAIFRGVVGQPRVVIYALIVWSIYFFSRKIWIKEFRKTRGNEH